MSHLIKVRRRHDLTNKKTMTKTDTKTQTMTTTNTFREHLPCATLETSRTKKKCNSCHPSQFTQFTQLTQVTTSHPSHPKDKEEDKDNEHLQREIIETFGNTGNLDFLTMRTSIHCKFADLIISLKIFVKHKRGRVDPSETHIYNSDILNDCW